MRPSNVSAAAGVPHVGCRSASGVPGRPGVQGSFRQAASKWAEGGTLSRQHAIHTCTEFACVASVQRDGGPPLALLKKQLLFLRVGLLPPPPGPLRYNNLRWAHRVASADSWAAGKRAGGKVPAHWRRAIGGKGGLLNGEPARRSGARPSAQLPTADEPQPSLPAACPPHTSRLLHGGRVDGWRRGGDAS